MASAEPGLTPAGAREDAAAARLIRRTLQQWWLIALCAVVAGVAGYFASSSREKEYSATATVQLNDIDIASVFLGQNLQQQGQDAQTKAATAAKLATLPRVREAASAALQGRLTPAELKTAISVTSQPDTTLVDITATTTSPQLAADAANAVREAYIKSRQEAASASLRNAQQGLQAQVDKLSEGQRETIAGQTLVTRLEQLNTLINAAGAGVTTAQPATPPTAASSPNPRRDAILAFIAGALLGTGIALLRARLDDRIRDADELSEHWDLPVLGLIPQTNELKDGSNHLASGSALEAFALARTNLRYLHVGGEVKTVVVTSAIAEEGKSTVAFNLAVAAAMADQKVLLVDADLRRPVIAPRAGIAGGRGLSEVLAGIAAPSEVVVPTKVNVAGGDVELGIVPAGLVPPSPIALLERAGTAELLTQLGEGYDLVFIDTPPATVVADAKVIMSHADGVVVVSRLGRVTRDAIDRLRELLAGLDTPVLGTVVNSGLSAKAYGYSSYESTPSTEVAPPSAPSRNGSGPGSVVEKPAPLTKG